MRWSDVADRAGKKAKEIRTSEEWAVLINEAVDKLDPLCRVTDTAEIVLSAGTAEYDVPATLKRASAVIFVRGDGEVPLSLVNWQNRYSAGYRLPPGKIQLQQITVQTGDKLLVVGPLKIPRITADEIDEGDEITIIPEEWQHLLISYCLWRVQQEEGWLAEAQQEEIRWLTGLDAFAACQFQSQATGKLQKQEYY